MASILIIDDDAQLRQSFNKLLSWEKHDVLTASTGEAGISLIKKNSFDLVILDVRLPGMNGLDAFEIIHKLDKTLPVIIMTAYTTTRTAIKATQMGAFEYIIKPFEVPDMLALINNAIEAGRLMRINNNDIKMPSIVEKDALIGSSRVMQEVYKSIGLAATTDATVLVQGESGTGKELVARAIYQYSKRSEKPFIVINCVAIPETLLESELFGYEKGAFTGAVNRQAGKIEKADGGTIFFDEIGDMPFSIQAKILRLLQERSIERLGGRGGQVSVDVRVITATNINLEKAVSDGKFREDLYYRIKVLTINLPTLSERRDDIPLLVNYFFDKFSKDMGKNNPGITKEAMALLHGLPWPGNVRELANVIQKALVFSRGYPVRPEDISSGLEEVVGLAELDETTAENVIRKWVYQRLKSGNNESFFDVIMDKFGSIIISEALNITEGNRTRAAKLLDLSRPTLQSKIEKYHLRIKTSVKNE